MFQTKVAEKIKTHILSSVTFSFRKSSRYEIICKNGVEPDRPQMTMWRMRIARWITKVTHTHTHTLRICNTYCFSTATVVVCMNAPPCCVLCSLSCIIFCLMPSSPKQLLPLILADWNLLCICCVLHARPVSSYSGLSARFHCVNYTDSKVLYFSLSFCEFLTLAYKSSAPRLVLSYFLIFDIWHIC